MGEKTAQQENSSDFAKPRPGPQFVPVPREPKLNTMAARLFNLQRTHGNQFVQRLLSSELIQTKLTVSNPGDQYEQEADRVADQIMRLQEPNVSRQPDHPDIHRVCDKCEEDVQRQPVNEEEEEKVQRQAEEDDDEVVQSKAERGGSLEVGRDWETRIEALRGGGQPLPETARAFFEPRFGYDFGQVRTHTDSMAAETARALRARAYTVGTDIAFGAGEYAPDTPEGQRLLAHELTHVVQQKNGACPEIQRQSLSDYNDKKQEHDPSKLTDAEIEATKEFQTYMNPKLVWQTKHKMTKAEALLACRLMLRHLREGAKITWSEDASVFMHMARSQLGALGEAEKLVGKLDWVGSGPSEFKSPGTAKSAFAKWLLAGGATPTDKSTMNCWEMILFGAFLGGVATKERLKKIYEDAAKKEGMDIPAEVEKNLCKGSKYIFDPLDPKSPEPLPGDIVIFETIATHAAIYLGKDAKSGQHKVISLWTPSGGKTEYTTIETLLLSPSVKGKQVKFCTAPW